MEAATAGAAAAGALPFLLSSLPAAGAAAAGAAAFGVSLAFCFSSLAAAAGAAAAGAVGALGLATWGGATAELKEADVSRGAIKYMLDTLLASMWPTWSFTERR